jgi:hypothetical protein
MSRYLSMITRDFVAFPLDPNSAQLSQRKTHSGPPRARIGTPIQLASVGRGYNCSLNKLRSITMHPLGLLLTDLLHRKKNDDGMKLPTQLEKFRCKYSDEAVDTALESKFAGVLRRWVNNAVRVRGGKKKMHEWTDDRDLTTLLAKEMAPLWKDDGTAFVTHEKVLPWGDSFCTTDIMILDTGTGRSHEDLPVHMIEVGLSNGHWWKTLHQGFMYIRNLLRFDMLQKPMLLTVLTLDAPPQNGSSKQIRRFSGGQVGVFLVTPKGCKKDFRMALLWREYATKEEDVAKWFVMIHRATEFVLKWNRDETAGDNSLDYEYLGPHCCRFGDEVSVGGRQSACSMVEIMLSLLFSYPTSTGVSVL